jgi:hypothetical protein
VRLRTPHFRRRAWLSCVRAMWSTYDLTDHLLLATRLSTVQAISLRALAVVDVKKGSLLHREPFDMRHYSDGDCEFHRRKPEFVNVVLTVWLRTSHRAWRRCGRRIALYWQFIDKNGTTKIKGSYSDVSAFAQNRAAVCVNDKWGLIDKFWEE